ncbi:MAG: DUF4177 domain-containing protein [Candidatus Didemnitutus sp.]|nr:DUF4177 domain-containing protein [Candidatus Didemnitutus sp.]
MSNWEYKVITSGKGGFASPALLEKFLNDLGQEEWEIIQFHPQPDNLLAFTGLVRRRTQRDWTLEDAAAAAARAEADKLRVEFEAKFKAAAANQPGQSAATDEAGEVFLAEERPGADDGFRRPVDTSRDQDADAPEDEAEKDDWDKLAEEDELPTFFDALRPHMRRNQRGPGMSVGVDYLAKKWKLEESDVKGALVECGLQIPADENAKPVYVEFEGELFWVNINRRGEIWINMREKPEPVFRIVQGKRLTDEEAPAETAPAPRHESRREERRDERRDDRREDRRDDRRDDRARENGAPASESAAADAGAASAPQGAPAPSGPRTLLDKIRGMMRRNRRGHGWSGSFGYLTKALKTDEAGLLAQLAELGLKMKEDGAEKPLFHEENNFLYWMDKNQRGEIWINARKSRGAGGEGDAPEQSGGDESAENSFASASEAPREKAAPHEEPPVIPVAPAQAGEASASAPSRVPASPLEAMRLLLQPKKRGDGVTAKIDDLSRQLERPALEILEALVGCGLNVPDDAKTKPTFGEHGGEIFWLNRNTKGELWLNAKASKSSGKRSRSRGRKDGEEGDGDDDSSGGDAAENE